MRYKIYSLCMLLLVSSVGVSQIKSIKAVPDPKTEKVLRKLERQWLDAYLKKDTVAMDRIVADDFTITYGDGTVRDKEQTIEGLKESKPSPNVYHWTDDSVVRIYGDAAIIVGKFIYRFTNNGETSISESRYTDTYLKRNGRWQVVASHLSNLVKK